MQENTESCVRFLLFHHFTHIPSVCAVVGPEIQRDERRAMSQKKKVGQRRKDGDKCFSRACGNRGDGFKQKEG